MPPIAPAKMTPQQQNQLARAAILQRSVEMTQSIFTTSFNPTNGNVLNIQPRYVGLIKGFWLEITATLTNAGAATVSLSDFAGANLLSNVTLTDLQNNVRINTSGWHLNFINSIRNKNPYFNSLLNNAQDCPINYGNNFNLFSQTATIATTASGTVKMWYWVPLAYSDVDFRGSIYANVVNATMNLQLTFNTQPGTNQNDYTSQVYKSATGIGSLTMTNVSLNVYQVYLDQLPTAQNGYPVLPQLDLSTIYELKGTSFSGMVTQQDFPMQYANFRDFLSTVLIFNNGSATTSGRSAGADLNYISLQSANYTNIFKRDPYLTAGLLRMRLGYDLPVGCYYFDTRQKPISTVQYGNMQLVLNPTGVIGADHSPYALVGYEDMALVTTISQAGSLAGN